MDKRGNVARLNPSDKQEETVPKRKDIAKKKHLCSCIEEDVMKKKNIKRIKIMMTRVTKRREAHAKQTIDDLPT